ncbi:hypothetical protein SAY86_030201 [Trapa natans]|uniref:Uncharacterized protein n=1 Tax=Trapa natans TaxID=22666 RepID=A0AAN7MKS8_TRANT|nr:hypothetical protein SAY86_030201 [Trapa natans]
MATASRSRARSGGKMPQPRRGARITTPYDRPPNTNLRAENPSWISKLILSPTRVIVSGAGKLLSSVFGSESSSSSSSGSGSISGTSCGLQFVVPGFFSVVGLVLGFPVRRQRGIMFLDEECISCWNKEKEADDIDLKMNQR